MDLSAFFEKKLNLFSQIWKRVKSKGSLIDFSNIKFKFAKMKSFNSFFSELYDKYFGKIPFKANRIDLVELSGDLDFQKMDLVFEPLEGYDPFNLNLYDKKYFNSDFNLFDNEFDFEIRDSDDFIKKMNEKGIAKDILLKEMSDYNSSLKSSGFYSTDQENSFIYDMKKKLTGEYESNYDEGFDSEKSDEIKKKPYVSNIDLEMTTDDRL